jgi:hypothetical protein
MKISGSIPVSGRELGRAESGTPTPPFFLITIKIGIK